MKYLFTKKPSIACLLGTVFFLLTSNENAFAEDWSSGLHSAKGFIINQGQYTAIHGKEVAFAYTAPGVEIFFTSSEIVFRSLKQTNSEEHQKEEREHKKDKTKTHEFEAHVELKETSMHWEGIQSNVYIEPSQQNSFYHNFSVRNAQGSITSIHEVPSYKKIIYHNIYPFTDLVFELHPIGGLKYHYILYPGASPNNIKMAYSGDCTKKANGDLAITSSFGLLTDQHPVSYYQDDKAATIATAFKLRKDMVSFEMETYDKNRTVVIDPWLQSPSFNTNWDCVWECERDAAGNVYIIGGVMPLQLLKFNPAGALQWTYSTPYDTSNVWLGTFAVDLAGNSYVASGSAAAIQKINTAGALVWNNANPGGLFSSVEFWSIAFNCDQSKLVVGGTGGLLADISPYMYDVDMNSGNIINGTLVHGAGSPFSIPPNTNEVRAITATKNNKYYFLTHDSLGYIGADLGLCTNTATPFHVANDNYNLSYKCEDWRYSNTGIEALAYYNDFIYVNRGNRLDKIEFATGVVVQSVNITGGGFTASFGQNSVQNSGIDIDDCGNIYVGSKNAILKFNTNLVQTGSFPTSFNVYDVTVSINGDVIAAGSTGNSNSNSRTGTVQSLAAAACVPQASICCDASVCSLPPLCITDAPVQLTPSVSGGLWSGSFISSSGIFDPAASGQGVFTVTYTVPCGSEELTITVNNCSALNVCEEANGTYTVTGGTGPYTWSSYYPASSAPITTQALCNACGYTWLLGTCLNGFMPATTCATWVVYANSNNAPAPTVFPAQVIDNAGTTFTMNSAGTLPACSLCPALQTANNISQPQCHGGTGNAVVTPNGGVGPYTFNWLPGNLAGNSQSNLSTGIYDVTITDANGCTGTTQVVITDPPALQATTFGAVNATCGIANGAAFAYAAGGNPPYDYLWSSGSQNLQITNNSSTVDSLTAVGAGMYQVIINDANGCQWTDSVEVFTTTPPSINASNVVNASCGVSNGSIQIAALNGQAPYDILWYNNNILLQSNLSVASGAQLNNIAAGSYVVIATDAASCADTLLVLVNNSNAATLNLIAENTIACFGDSAQLVVQASGGTSPYTITWSLNGGSIQTHTGNISYDTLFAMQPGVYLVQITDNLNCISTIQAPVAGPLGPLQIQSITTTSASCGNSDGSIAVLASGGNQTSVYSFQWLPQGGASSTATSLPAGLYTLTVTDGSGCITDTLISLNNTNGPQVSIANITNLTCNGLNNGTAQAIATGGTGALTYAWSGGTANGPVANNLGAGSYTVSVSDALGCYSFAAFSINQPNPIEALLTTTPAFCGKPNGTASAIASGGTGALTYSWSNGATTSTVNALPSGLYNVVVTDSLGCIQVFSTTIGTSGNIDVDAGLDITINGGTSIELTATGPASAVYSWSPIEFLSCVNCSSTVATPPYTTFFVVSAQENGCVVTDTVKVEVEIKCGDVYVPSAFSPNGDGNNDVLYLRGNCLVELEFKVYDRWGELIFSTTDQRIGWDGMYKGKTLNEGVYVYYVSARAKGEILKIQGNVTLLRN